MSVFKRYRWVLLGLVVLALLVIGTLFIVHLNDDTAWARIQQRGVITFAMDPTYPPFETLDGNGQFAGFDVELAQALAQRLGYKAEFEAVAYDGLIGTLITQRDDVVISAWVIQPERGKEASFSPTYFNAGVLLVTKANTVVDGDPMQWATGKTLTAEFGSTGDALARKWSRLVAGLTPASEADAATALQWVSEGKADGALVDAVPAFDYLKTDPSLKVAAAISESDAPYVLAVSAKSPVLLRMLTQAMTGMEQDGSLGDLRAKWFGEAARELVEH